MAVTVDPAVAAVIAGAATGCAWTGAVATGWVWTGADASAGIGARGATAVALNSVRGSSRHISSVRPGACAGRRPCDLALPVFWEGCGLRTIHHMLSAPR